MSDAAIIETARRLCDTRDAARIERLLGDALALTRMDDTDPVYAEMLSSIKANADQPIRVVVLRNGEPVELSVKPERAFQGVGEADAKVGADFISRGEEDRAVVAMVQPGSPAATLRMPRGSEIIAIDGQPVTRGWYEVIERFRAAAGGRVQVAYRTGEDVVTAPMQIPSSVVNELKLPPLAEIRSINDMDSIEVRQAGQARRYRLPEPLAVRRILESFEPGTEVEIVYAPEPHSRPGLHRSGRL